jgi:AraC-like DNA-binding protein
LVAGLARDAAMTGSGTALYDDPDGYQVGIEGAAIRIVVTGGGDFKARLTWLSLRRLYACCGSEKLSRIAYVSLAPERVFVSFPINRSCSMYDGVKLQPGDVVFHGTGERLYHSTVGSCQWGLVSLPPEQLAASARALTGKEIFPPPVGRVFRPSKLDATRLLRLHSKACRLAETRHELVANPQVARALEQDLLHALVNCLTPDGSEGDVEPRRRHHAEIMIRFEEALAEHTGRHFTMPELCARIGVPERTLRTCCTEFLGMSPTRYLLMQRLNMTRSALRRADPATASVAEIARNYQFPEPGRFAVTYRNTFGELPSATLRRAPGEMA